MIASRVRGENWKIGHQQNHTARPGRSRNGKHGLEMANETRDRRTDTTSQQHLVSVQRRIGRSGQIPKQYPTSLSIEGATPPPVKRVRTNLNNIENESMFICHKCQHHPIEPSSPSPKKEVIYRSQKYAPLPTPLESVSSSERTRRELDQSTVVVLPSSTNAVGRCTNNK